MECIRWAFNFRNWSPKRDEWMFCMSIIQQEEKERISKFVFNKDAKASLAGRLLIRKVVAEKLNIPWSNFKIERTEKGRPFLKSNEHQGKLDFNVSHHGKWVVLAAESTGSKVGIDVVEITKAADKNVPEFFRLMKRQFTTDEWSIIRKNSYEDDQLKSFYRNWCLKEAFVKSLGVGISYNLQSISFAPVTQLKIGSLVRDTTVTVNGHVDTTWVFEECLLDENHIVAVAFQPHNTVFKEVPFKILELGQLIANSQQITPPDPEIADNFILKEESPFCQM